MIKKKKKKNRDKSWKFQFKWNVSLWIVKLNETKQIFFKQMHKDSIDKTGTFPRMVKKLIEQIGMDEK